MSNEFYTIDFETYYSKDYSLGKLTTQEYICGEEFEIIGVGLAKNQEPAKWYSFDNLEDYESLLAPLHGEMVMAHNAMFDVGILGLIFNIRPKLIVDTLSMARPLFGLTVGGSLKALAEKYQIGQKGTEVINALGKHRSDFTADELAAYGEYCKNDVELTRRLFPRLRKYTTNEEMLVIDRTIRMFTEPVLRIDRALLETELANERKRKETLVASLGVEKSDLMSNKKFAELLEQHGVVIPMKISPTTRRETYPFAKTDKFMADLQNHEDDTIRMLAEARLANKSTLNETRMERLIDLSQYGRFAVPIGYCGAVTTWRWSGQDRLNLQNLPRGGVIRKAICAPKYHKLVVVDSSNIELRTNHTLAGQTDTVEMLRAGRDLYKEFAAILYNKEVGDVTKEERFVGKVAHLSLGYGCGWRKFKEMCRNWGLDITDEEAEHIVALWRNTYTAIPRLWRSADRLIKAIAERSEFALPTAPFVRSKDGMLFTPPKHYIQYPNLTQNEDGEYTYTSRRGRGTETVKLYGGKCVENLCQHISRNIIAEQFVKLSGRYRVAMQVHDEFVLVVPDGKAEEALAWAVEVMSTSPSWWPEIPLAAEGSIADRYGDAK